MQNNEIVKKSTVAKTRCQSAGLCSGNVQRRRSRTSRRQRQSKNVMRIDEDVSKTFTLPPLRAERRAAVLRFARNTHTCPHYFAGVGAGAGAGAARYLSNQRTMAANIS